MAVSRAMSRLMLKSAKRASLVENLRSLRGLGKMRVVSAIQISSTRVGIEDRVDHRNQRTAPEPWIAHTQAAPNSGTSWKSCPGSAQSPAPPRAGSSPRRIQTNEPPHKFPPQTSPAALRINVRKRSAPKVAGFYSATQPQNVAAPWPTIAPPRTGSQSALRGSGGRRHEVHNLGRLLGRHAMGILSVCFRRLRRRGCRTISLLLTETPAASSWRFTKRGRPPPPFSVLDVACRGARP
jgi:hypothetical protein